ncbi:MAG: hypothetical protein Ta2A_11090 [Treponemataceae bacterium]|nr:MAG: hypothetical protein Ta2A_11090 [Treponemataceae bacterium]
MALIKLDIKFPKRYLEQLQVSEFTEEAFPIAAGGLKAAAAMVAARWKRFAGGADNIEGVTPLKHPNGEYARSIERRRQGQWKYEVFSDAKVAEWIEYGTKGADLKKTHPYGRRSRLSKDGKSSYLIVPFRWGTPSKVGGNTMGINVYEVVKKFKMTETKSTAFDTQTANASGYAQTRHAYKKGGKLTAEDAENKNQIGMIRSKGKAGDKAQSSGYFTFRIISSKSTKGWVVPPRPARDVTYHLQQQMQKNVEKVIGAAWNKQLQELFD